MLPGFESPAADVRCCEPSYRRSHTGLPYIRKSQLGSGQSAPRRRDRRSSRISTPGFSRRGESRNFFLLVLNRKFSVRLAVYFHFNPCAFEERRLWKNRLKPFHTCSMWKYWLHSFRGISESKHPRCQKGFKKTYFFPLSDSWCHKLYNGESETGNPVNHSPAVMSPGTSPVGDRWSVACHPLYSCLFSSATLLNITALLLIHDPHGRKTPKVNPWNDSHLWFHIIPAFLTPEPVLGDQSPGFVYYIK